MHKKYTFKNGKLYGPYLYENKRVGEKVVTTYVGKDTHRMLSFVVVGTIVALLLIGAFFFRSFSPTGHVSLDMGSSYNYGEHLDGTLKLSLKQGELVPADAVVKVKNGQQEVLIPLSALVGQQQVQGTFYAEGTGISGNGSGYGLAGSKTIYPTLSFEILISSSSQSTTPEPEANTSNPSLGGSGGSSNPENEPATTTSEPVQPTESTPLPEQPEQPQAQEQTSAEPSASTPADITSTQSNSPETTSTSESASSDISTESSSSSSESSQSDASSDAVSSGITGAVIGENEYVVSGSVNKGNSFTYNLEEGQSVSVVDGSVKIGDEHISESEIDLSVSSGKVEVTTDYELVERGFGQEYLGNDEVTLLVDLSAFGINVTDANVEISLEYGNESIASVSKRISVANETVAPDMPTVNETNVTSPLSVINATLNYTNMTIPIINETIAFNLSITQLKPIPTIRIGQNSSVNVSLKEYFIGAESFKANISDVIAAIDGEMLTLTAPEGFYGARQGRVYAYNGSEKIESNAFNILVSKGIAITTTRDKIVAGEQVRWVKSISLDEPQNLTVELPAVAENISVNAVESDKDEKPAIVEVNNITISLINANVVAEIDIGNEGFIARFFKKLFSSFTGRVVDEPIASSEPIEITLADNATQYSIEYYTPAPEINETAIDNGKQITISAGDELNYTDVIAFTNLPFEIGAEQIDQIKLYWDTYIFDATRADAIKNVSAVENTTIVEDVVLDANGSIISSMSTSSSGRQVYSAQTRQEMPFDAYDLDFNGMYDYIEWVVPHLSNQTFTLVMNSTNTLTSNITYTGNYSHLTLDRTKAPYTSLLGYWNYDFYVDGGNISDMSGNNRQADMRGANVVIAPGIFGNAYYASNKSASPSWLNQSTVPNEAPLRPASFTFTAWVMLPLVPSAGTSYALVKGAGGSGYFDGFRCNSDGGNMWCAVANSSSYWSAINSTLAMQPGIWSHYVLSYNATNGNVSLYDNGIVRNVDTMLGGIYRSNDGSWMSIGSVEQQGINTWPGYIDEVMFFNSSLTAQQVLDIYNNQSARFVSQGLIDGKQFNISQQGDLSVNVTIDDFKRYAGANIAARVGRWDVSQGYNDTDSSLEAYYTADGNASDISGNSKHGSLMNGATATQQGVYNNSFYFDGVDDYVNASSVRANTSKVFSAFAWVYPLSNSGFRSFLSEGCGGFILGINGTQAQYGVSCSSQSNITTTGYTSTSETNYTVPAGVSIVTVKTWGAGGSGAGGGFTQGNWSVQSGDILSVRAGAVYGVPTYVRWIRGGATIGWAVAGSGGGSAGSNSGGAGGGMTASQGQTESLGCCGIGGGGATWQSAGSGGSGYSCTGSAGSGPLSSSIQYNGGNSCGGVGGAGWYGGGSGGDNDYDVQQVYGGCYCNSGDCPGTVTGVEPCDGCPTGPPSHGLGYTCMIDEYTYYENGGGGGGSGYVSNATGTINITGSGSNVANSADADYLAGKGNSGQLGYVVLKTYSEGSSGSQAMYGGYAPLSSWTHIGAVYNGTNTTLYVNGAAVAVGIGNFSGLAQSLYIGKYDSSSLYNFSGLIDEAIVFNKTFSADEVKALYTRGRANWNYTAYQNITDFNATRAVTTFEIKNTTTNILPSFMLTSNSQFATPYIATKVDTPINFSFWEIPVNSCTNITSSGSYGLSSSLTGSAFNNWGCINITAANVILDCKGYEISNNTHTGNGIFISGSNATVKNCNISLSNSGSATGIRMHSSAYGAIVSNNTIQNSIYGIQVFSSNNTLQRNSVSNISTYGIYLSSSNFNSLTNNDAHADLYAIYLTASSDNNITNSIVRGSLRGIFFSTSSNNILENSIAQGSSQFGIYIFLISNYNALINNTVYNNSQHGIYLSGSNSNILLNNTVYNNSQEGIYLQSSINNTLLGNIAVNNLHGIILSTSLNSTLANNSLYSNVYGLYLTGSSSNSIVNNTVYGNGNGIILLSSSNNNTINSSVVYNNSNTGVALSGSSYNVVGDSVIYNNSLHGINLSSSNHNIILNSVIFNNMTRGVLIRSGSSNNTLVNTTTYNNAYGVYLLSPNNSIYGLETFNNTATGLFLSSTISDLPNSASYCVIANVTSYGNPTGLIIGNSFSNFSSIMTYGNSGSGISFTAGSGVTGGASSIYTNVSSFNNQLSGAIFQLYGNSVFYNFSVYNNSQYGLSFIGSTSNMLLENISVDENRFNGISISSTSNRNLTFANGSISDNGISGTYSGFSASSGSTNISVLSSIIHNNTGGGISLTSSPFAAIKNNLINDNVGHGIYLSSAAHGQIYNNSVYRNILSGVYMISSSYNNTLWNNILSGSAYGLYLDVSVQNNSFASMLINGSTQRAIYFASTGINGNNFTDIGINNTVAAGYDVYISSSAADNNYFVDTPIANYSILTNSKLFFKTSGLGEIRFLTGINGTGTNLSDDVRVRSNYAYVDNSKIGLDRPANVTLYDVSVFEHASVLRNGFRCPSRMCSNFTALSGAAVSFNVTGWSNYSIGNISTTSLTNCSSEGCLYVRNGSGSNRSIFDKEGNLDIAGVLVENNAGSPNGRDFIIKNSSGNVVAWIDDSTGDIRLAGMLVQGQGTSCAPSGNNFIVRNSSGSCVAYINSTGSLWLKGGYNSYEFI